MDTRIIILISLILINPVSAKFICGQVESQDNLYPSWYTVKATLGQNQTIQTSCQVSPQGLKYCCDISSLKETFNYTWALDDTFQVKISDPTSNYFAPTKTLNLTSQDPDISPVLEIKKAILINPEIEKISISKEVPKISISAQPECEEIENIQELKLGKNEIQVQTKCQGETFTLNKTMYILEEIELEKSPSKISSEKTQEFQIKLTSPIELENIKVKEYIPSSFQIISVSDNGQIKKSTKDYNEISWQFNGKNFEASYVLKAPKVSLLPKNYETITSLEDQTISKNTLKVQNILPFPSTSSSQNSYKQETQTLSKISQVSPIIAKEKNITAALYSKSPKESESFIFQEFETNEKINRSYEIIKAYQIISSLSKSEQKELKLIYETSTDFLEEKNYKEIEFFAKDEDKFFRINSTKNSENEKITYQVSSFPVEEIYLFGEKNHLSFWDKILIFLSKLKA